MVDHIQSHPPLRFACKCLNVRLTTVQTQSSPPESTSDAAYTKIHVGDEGIHVAQPQLTVRVKSRPVSIPGTSRCSRLTTLTCLVCDIIVYQIHQVISAEAEAKDLPILPSEDWAEQDIMKSSNGWIDVHEECLSDDAIAQAESSDNYSLIYSLILPSALESTAPPSPKARISPESTASSTPTPANPAPYLNKLPPLFPPPPFTPSHPTFLHLLSLAEKESHSLRATAEEEIATVVRAKAAEVQAKEAELKLIVERLWAKFRQGLVKVQQDRSLTSSSRHDDHRNGSHSHAAPVAVRSFDIVSVTPPPRHTQSSTPKISALSVSLANSNLHQVMVDRNSNTSDTSSINSPSPTLVQTSTNEHEGSTIRQFRRVADESINTAASHRYFLNLDEEMARHKKERENERKRSHEDETMGITGASKPRGQGNNNNNRYLEPQPNAAVTDAKVDNKKVNQDQSNDKESKGKRKQVHFDVKPIAKAAKETPNNSEKPRSPDSREMIFPLDDDLDDDEGEPSNVQHTLPLLEQPSIPPRGRGTRPQPPVGLPFAALRPASLPAPSHIRPIRGPPGIDTSSNNIMLSLPRTSGPVSKPRGEAKDDATDLETSEDTTDSSPRQTPSSDSDSEDNEGYHYRTRYGIPGSLPINIVSLTKPREVLSLASYQPKADRPAMAPSLYPKSSTAARKAAYAARDRTRSLDPGSLDFVAEEEEESEEEEEMKMVSQSLESGERAKKYALKILEARADLPEEGMWRSLAS